MFAILNTKVHCQLNTTSIFAVLNTNAHYQSLGYGIAKIESNYI
jgi:hypothetical protein